ncbi:MAG: tRNA pseudouridine(13) synthase TruD [bacterium]
MKALPADDINKPSGAAGEGMDKGLDWPVTAPVPLAGASIRCALEDFQVDEIPPCLPEGEGEHVWVHIRKRGMNTLQVVDRLSAALGVHPGMISFAGQKDRHAVTTQWFSVHVPGKLDPDLSRGWSDDLQLLEAKRHNRKLRRGALKGNRFKLVLRACEGDVEATDVRLQQVSSGGVPDYFGEQRFGRDGSNVDRFGQLIAGRLPRAREKRSMMLSSARSWLFNQVLAERVREGSWNKFLAGEVVMLAGSRSVFVADEVDDELQRRLQENDIHPTAPLPGSGTGMAAAEAAELEERVLKPWETLLDALVREKVKEARRPTRLIPEDMNWKWHDKDTLELSFILPPGAYATAILRELAVYRDRRGKGVPESLEG